MQKEPSKIQNILQERFEKNMQRHKEMEWNKVLAKLESSPDKLRALSEMEETGGEPDVVGQDSKTGEFIFMDCSPETPAGRRNTCYDKKGQDEREKQGIHPQGSAVEMADKMGIDILDEEQYKELQKLGKFDTKTSSWIKTPKEIRELGGALYGDNRYAHVFIYHNGAQSFYSTRGFRGILKV